MKNKSFDIPLMALFGVFVVASGMFAISSVRQLNSIYKNVAYQVPATSQLAQAGGGGSVDLFGYAWSSNTGWISFNSTNPGAGGGSYKVSISTTTQTPSIGKFDGYAWSSNVGWISFNSGDISGCPVAEAAYDRPESTGPGNYGAPLPNGISDICTPRVDLSASGSSAGKVSGWARILSMKAENGEGWLHLSGTNHPSGVSQPVGSRGVTYTAATGAFTGYAWEPSSVGWINFDLTLGYIPTTPPPVLTGGDCVASPSGTVAPNTPVTFQANATSGTSPFTYSWSGAAYGSSKQKQISYPASGAGPTVRIKDTNSIESPVIPCPSVTVNSPTPLSLRIGSTPATARLAPSTNAFGIRQGNEFALKWENNLGAAFNDCDIAITNNGSTYWGGAVNTDLDDSITAGDISNLSTVSPVARGVYTFTLSCTDGTTTQSPPEPTVLRIVGVSGEEF